MISGRSGIRGAQVSYCRLTHGTGLSARGSTTIAVITTASCASLLFLRKAFPSALSARPAATLRPTPHPARVARPAPGAAPAARPPAPFACPARIQRNQAHRAPHAGLAHGSRARGRPVAFLAMMANTPPSRERPSLTSARDAMLAPIRVDKLCAKNAGRVHGSRALVLPTAFLAELDHTPP